MSDYPDRLQVRPITIWPTSRTPTSERKHSPFRTPWRQTLDLLDRELFHAGATKDVYLEVAIPDGDANWRQDGRPRAHAKADHPGVVIVFKAYGATNRFATDRFTTWQDNLRAIALGLEALRKVDRYGITDRGQQYKGFQELPRSTSEPDPDKGRAIVTDRFGGDVTAALKALHPDSATGNRLEFEHVVAYRDQQRQLAAA